MIAVSKSSLDYWGDLAQSHDQIPEECKIHKEMVMNRFENMNVTAGLVLTTSAVFISTNPPLDPLMPYGSHGSYILQMSAFVAALISLMTGTSVLIIYDTCYANRDILKFLMNSRWRRVCCLIMMAYPSLALAVSTLTLLTAFFIAGCTSDKLFVKIMTAGTYLSLMFLGLLALCVFGGHVTEFTVGHDEGSHDIHNSPGSEEKVRDSGVSHIEQHSGSV